jgi:hypothetical protein
VTTGNDPRSATILSPIDFPEHDVDRADQRNDIGHQVTPDQPPKRLKITE